MTARLRSSAIVPNSCFWSPNPRPAFKAHCRLVFVALFTPDVGTSSVNFLPLRSSTSTGAAILSTNINDLMLADLLPPPNTARLHLGYPVMRSEIHSRFLDAYCIHRIPLLLRPTTRRAPVGLAYQTMWLCPYLRKVLLLLGNSSWRRLRLLDWRLPLTDSG